MDVILLDEYVNDRCGEVYISNDGVLIFLCTLCNETFKGYGFYLEHILYEHDLPVYSVEENITSEAAVDIVKSEKVETEMDFAEMVNDFEECSSIKSEIESLAVKDEFVELENVPSDENENIFQQEEFLIEPDSEVSQSGDKLPSSTRKSKDSRTTSGDFECPYCKLHIKGKSNLDKHVLRHNDKNKRYQCSYCPKRFHVRFEKYQHECSHTGERSFLCTECGKGFISNGKLNEHINMTHRNMRSKQCDICQKNFYSNKYLKRHMLIHKPERDQICNTCGASFKLRKTLIAHNKIHENKLEHECQLCNAKFNQRPALHSHMKNRHKEEIKLVKAKT